MEGYAVFLQLSQLTKLHQCHKKFANCGNQLQPLVNFATAADRRRNLNEGLTPQILFSATRKASSLHWGEGGLCLLLGYPQC